MEEVAQDNKKRQGFKKVRVHASHPARVRVCSEQNIPSSSSWGNSGAWTRNVTEPQEGRQKRNYVSYADAKIMVIYNYYVQIICVIVNPVDVPRSRSKILS